MVEEILLSSLRLSLPLIFAALGGLLSERSGVANIALESFLLFAAFAAGAGTDLSGSLAVGVGCGLVASVLTGALFAFLCLWGRGDQIVIGTAMNLLAMGLIPVFCRSLFGVTGSTPSLPLTLRFTEPLYFVGVALLVVGLYVILFRFTQHGIRIIAAGENPAALVTQGVSDRWVRVRAILEGAAVVGIGGVYLCLCQGSGYIRNMSAGRGFIALAALIFGGWRPIPTFLACCFFGLAEAIQIQLQGKTTLIPHQFVQMIPYLVTFLVLLVLGKNIKAPSAINRLE